MRWTALAFVIASCGPTPRDHGDDGNEACAPGAVEACGGSGQCAGERHCDANSRWGACTGVGTPSAEICDGRDNDCDGIVDNGAGTYCMGAALRWIDHGGTATVPGSRAQALDIAAASDGTIYAVGSHDHTATFGATITNDAGTRSDGFVVKYASKGQLLWHRAISGPGDATVTAIAIAPDNTVIVGGSFGGFPPNSVDFAQGVTRTPIGGTDLFVARYTADGTILSVATFASDNDDELLDLAVSASGAIAITGRSVGTSLALGTATIPRSHGNWTYFVAHLDASFAVDWARRIELADPATGDITGHAVAFDDAGNVYAGGSVLCFTNCAAPQLVINRGAADEAAVPLDNPGFLVRYAANGSLTWSRTPVQVNALAVAGTAVYATGAFGQVAQLGGQSLTARGRFDAWLGSFGTDGAFAWAKNFGSPTSCSLGIASAPDDAATAIAIDGNAPVVAGVHQQTIELATDLTLAGDGWGNAFWAGYDASGAVRYAQHGRIGDAPCTGGALATAIAVAPNGDLAVAGNFTSHMILPSTTITGGNDFFVARFAK